MVLSNLMPSGVKPREKIPTSEESLADKDITEQRLKEMIEDIDGVSDVSVFVVYENSGVKNIATSGEENTTYEGDKSVTRVRKDAVSQRDGTTEKPFVTEEVLPEVRGIIIAARGIKTASLDARITDAVSSAMGVPIHRVKILQKD